jgi:hypothetical protein
MLDLERFADIAGLDLDVVQLLEEEDEVGLVPGAAQELEQCCLALVEVAGG